MKPVRFIICDFLFVIFYFGLAHDAIQSQIAK